MSRFTAADAVATARRELGVPILRAFAAFGLVALAAAGAAPALGAEVYLAPEPVRECPCGHGTPPPAPCGASSGHPLACFEDAYALASRPGDAVVFLAGTHDACLDLGRSGTRRRPFVYRSATPGAAEVRCARDGDAVRVTGGFNVLEGLRITGTGRKAAALRVDGRDPGGPVRLRNLEITGPWIGLFLGGPGSASVEDVSIHDVFAGLVVDSSDNTIRGVTIRRTSEHGMLFYPGASRNQVEDGTIEEIGLTGVAIARGATDQSLTDLTVDGAGAHGVEVRGDRTTLRRCHIARARGHGVLVTGEPWSVERPRIERCDIHHNGGPMENGRSSGDGVKLESGRDAVVVDSHIHHNADQGVFESAALHTTMERCEIDHNGSTRWSHGIYIMGRGGVVRACRIHDNAGFGVHLWVGPSRYLVIDNEITGNGLARGGGIVIGGDSAEAPPGHSGYPEEVIARRNRVANNRGAELYYLIVRRGTPAGGCTPAAGGNAFIDNLLEPSPGGQAIAVVGEPESCLTLEGNVVRESADDPDP